VKASPVKRKSVLKELHGKKNITDASPPFLKKKKLKREVEGVRESGLWYVYSFTLYQRETLGQRAEGSVLAQVAITKYYRLSGLSS